MSNFNDSALEDAKKLIQEIQETGVKKDLSKEEQDQIAQLLESFQKQVSELKDEYNNEIPFSILKEKTGLNFDIIKTCLLQLITNNKILGFINDNATPDLSDDILILRDKRFVDEMEPEYRTG